MEDLFGFQGATGEEIADLARMSLELYDDVPDDVPSNQARWVNITSQMGLPVSSLGPDNASYIPLEAIADAGEAGETAIYQNSDGNTLALAFQGTGDLADALGLYIDAILPIPILSDGRIIELFEPLANTLQNYLASNSNITRVLMTGHSLGGSIAQRLMDVFFQGDEILSGVTFGSPNLDSDDRILHIGNEFDPVYGLVSDEKGNSTTGLTVKFASDIPKFLGGLLGTLTPLDNHDPRVYVEAVDVLGTSIFSSGSARSEFVDSLPLIPAPLFGDDDIQLSALFPDLVDISSDILVLLDDQETQIRNFFQSSPSFVLAGDDLVD
jgi:hypothetical protein